MVINNLILSCLLLIESEVQIIQFINEIYTVASPKKSIYELKLINMEEVHYVVNQYTDLMKHKNRCIFNMV